MATIAPVAKTAEIIGNAVGGSRGALIGIAITGGVALSATIAGLYYEYRNKHKQAKIKAK
jgi:ascorbate-specific PTS system EIIC-type component UlaA